jgi:hypothetical protein
MINIIKKDETLSEYPKAFSDILYSRLFLCFIFEGVNVALVHQNMFEGVEKCRSAEVLKKC